MKPSTLCAAYLRQSTQTVTVKTKLTPATIIQTYIYFPLCPSLFFYLFRIFPSFYAFLHFPLVYLSPQLLKWRKMKKKTLCLMKFFY